MPATYGHLIDELRTPTREFRHAAPEAWAGFAKLHEATMSDGAVPTRLKELTALAIAVTEHCDGCIAYHAKAAATAGASREEAAEMLAVALLMGGGPASVYGPRALATFDEAQAALDVG